jgi:hypothetical protein
MYITDNQIVNRLSAYKKRAVIVLLIIILQCYINIIQIDRQFKLSTLFALKHYKTLIFN